MAKETGILKSHVVLCCRTWGKASPLRNQKRATIISTSVQMLAKFGIHTFHARKAQGNETPADHATHRASQLTSNASLLPRTKQFLTSHSLASAGICTLMQGRIRSMITLPLTSQPSSLHLGSSPLLATIRTPLHTIKHTSIDPSENVIQIKLPGDGTLHIDVAA
jgi:hypothetical protein